MQISIEKVRIKIGAKAKQAKRYLLTSGDRFGAVAVDPWSCRCADCGCKWDCGPLMDVQTVSCSNCYSDAVLLVAIRIGIPDKWEVDGSEMEPV